MNRKIILFVVLLSVTFIFSLNRPLFSISVAMKVESDYRITLKNLQFASVAVDNFADTGQKKKYEEIKTIFTNASEDFYSQNYESSFKKFIQVKENLAGLFDELTKLYLSRSKEILDSTSKDAFNILIDYRKDSNLAKSFRNPYSPVEDVKMHNEQDYHYFHDRDRIEKYLNKGYNIYNEAKLAYNDPDFVYAKSKNNKSKFNQDYILDTYVKIITFCREAKMYGLEIHKIFNTHRIGDIVTKYNIYGDRIEPVFDERIPENYRIDAVDNEKASFPQEQKKLEKYKKSLKN